MSNLSISIADVVEHLFERTIVYLSDDMGVSILSKTPHVSLGRLQLKDITAVVGGTGLLGGVFLLSVDEALAKKIVHAFVFGDVTQEEEDELIEESVKEILNIVLGNALENCANSSDEMGITIPMLISDMSTLLEYKHTIFQDVCTASGNYTLAYLY